jgi:hypothetical protein
LKAEVVRPRAKPKKQQQEIAYERNVIRVPARSLKERFSRGSVAWKEQSDPIFRFWAEGDWWGIPFFSLSARYFSDKETLCLYWTLGTVVIAGPEGSGFLRCVLCSPGNFTQTDGKDILSVKMVMNSESPRSESGHFL